MIGRTVGNYRVLKLLGEGGMGAVYLAEHPGIGRLAAVKVLHPQLAQSEDILVRFFNEARAANAIRHPGIVEIFDMGTLPDGATYIIMELLEGESLAARMARERMSVPVAVELAGQTAAAVGAAHAKGIVHRDSKPDNIFVIPDPQNPGRDLVKVLDFGIAKLAAEPAGGSGSVRTRTGVVMGTPLYMSPEQCRGTKEVDHRTDLYALGVILYEMVCGVPPFVLTGHGELIHMHIAEAPPPPRVHSPDIPESLEAVILRALAKDPAERFPDMAAFRQALRTRTKGWGAPRAGDAMPQLGAMRPTEPLPVTTLTSATASVIAEAETFRPRRSWLWPVVLLGLGGAAAAGFMLTRSGEDVAPEPVAAAAHETVPAPVATTPPAPAPAESAVASIAVTITTVPPGARVIRVSDEARIGTTPFSQKWPRGTRSTKLRLELPGYEAKPVTVAVDLGDVDLRDVELVKLAPPPRPSRPAESRRPKAPAARPTVRPESAPAAPPRPSEPVPL